MTLVAPAPKSGMVTSHVDTPSSTPRRLHEGEVTRLTAGSVEVMTVRLLIPAMMRAAVLFMREVYPTVTHLSSICVLFLWDGIPKPDQAAHKSRIPKCASA